jgi:hypothetical protein
MPQGNKKNIRKPKLNIKERIKIFKNEYISLQKKHQIINNKVTIAREKRTKEQQNIQKTKIAIIIYQ